jgi:putative PIN family toxin of toxin-antitoxin system
MIRVVFDTNILFSAAFKSVGVPAQVLDLVTPGILTPCISDAIMAEYLDVLTRPILRPHAARARDVLALMAKIAVHVSPTLKLSLCSDPDDNRFLECALAAQAAYLVTGNLRHFPKDYEPVAIVTPRQFLNLLIADPA